MAPTAAAMIVALTAKLAVFAGAWLASLALHEGWHAAMAICLGHGRELRLRVHLSRSAAASVHVPNIDTRDALLIRHAGWMASVAIAAILSWKWRMMTESWVWAALAGCWCVAAEAVSSDLLGLVGVSLSKDMATGETFCCGNFGVLVLRALSQPHVLPVLRRMMQTTMLRGAQSAGIVSFAKHRWRAHAHRAKRSRVVNGKRTDLCDLLLPPGSRAHGLAPSGTSGLPKLYSGHTRFATSSRASMDGCHPHSWSAALWQTEWQYSPIKRTYEGHRANVEAFVTHNGDLDYWEVNGHEYPLSEVQKMLPAVLHQPLPSTTDSACLAGLFELLRTRGLWLPSVRHGLLFGALNVAGAIAEESASRTGGRSGADPAVLHGPSAFWRLAKVQQVAAIFEAVWKKVLKESTPTSQDGLLGPLPLSTSYEESLDDSKHSVNSSFSFENTHLSSHVHDGLSNGGSNGDGGSTSGAPVAPRQGGSVHKSIRRTRLSHVGDEPSGHRQGCLRVGDLSQAELVERERQKRYTQREKQAAEAEGNLCAHLHDKMVATLVEGHLPVLRRLLRVADVVHASTDAGRLSEAEEDACLRCFVRVSVSAFLYNDMLYAGKELLRRAKGSFGIVLSHTLDCGDSFLIGARGQTMSVGFYPHLGMVLFGSEAAATKAAMGLKASPNDNAMDDSKLGGASFDLRTNQLKSSFRLELDDLGGEVVLVTWANGESRDPSSTAGSEASWRDASDAPPTCGYLERRFRRQDDNHAKCEATSHVIDGGGMRCDVISLKEVRHAVHKPFFQRVMRLDGNPLIEPLVPITADPVGQDLREIPRVLQRCAPPSLLPLAGSLARSDIARLPLPCSLERACTL